jgi:hypothetical protein
MKSLFILLAFGVCVPALAANPPAVKAAPAKAAASQTPGASGGYWCRAANGNYFWIAPTTPIAKAPAESSQQKPAPGPTRVYTYYRPNVATTYPDSFRPEVVNGVDWYLNGRSYFSDLVVVRVGLWVFLLGEMRKGHRP